MKGRSAAASTIIERLNTGVFGDGVPQKGRYGDIPDREDLGETTDAEVEQRPGKGVSQHIKGYEAGKFIGGMGGDIPFPFSMGTFSATEGDSAMHFPQFSTPDGKVRRAPSGGTVERGSADDPVDEKGARRDGGAD